MVHPNRKLEARAQNAYPSFVSIQHHHPIIPEHTTELPNITPEAGHHPITSQIKHSYQPPQISFLPSQLPASPSSDSTMPAQPILSSPYGNLHGPTCPPTIHTCSCSCVNSNRLLGQAQSLSLSSLFQASSSFQDHFLENLQTIHREPLWLAPPSPNSQDPYVLLATIHSLIYFPIASFRFQWRYKTLAQPTSLQVSYPTWTSILDAKRGAKLHCHLSSPFPQHVDPEETPSGPATSLRDGSTKFL